jgi:hypothetical protein
MAMWVILPMMNPPGFSAGSIDITEPTGIAINVRMKATASDLLAKA